MELSRNWKKLCLLLVALTLSEIASPLLTANTLATLAYYGTAGKPISAAISAGGEIVSDVVLQIALIKATPALLVAKTVAAVCAAVPIWDWFALGLAIGFA